MYITNVSARGFKRGAFNVALGRATVVTGDNFAGKTQILDAVRLGLIGHLPELGNTPRATFGLASGPRLEVALTFDNGEVLSREFWLEGNSVKSRHVVPPSLKDCPLLAVMLNAEEYFALGPLDRTRYVFANCPTEAPGREAIAARVAKVAPGYDMEQVFAGADGEEDGPQAFLEGILKFVAEHWTNLKRTVDMHQGTINGLTTQRADEEKTPPLSALEDELAVVRRAVAEITERKGAVIGRFTKMKSDRHRRAEIDREIQHGSKTRATLATLQNRLGLLRGQVEQLPTVTPEAVEAAIKRCGDAANTINVFKKGLAAAQESRVKAERDLAEIDGKDSCPYCGATGDGWKTLKAAELAQGIDALNKCAEDFKVSLVAADAELAAAQAAFAEQQAEVKRQKDLVADRDQTATAAAKLEPELARLGALTEERERLTPDDANLEALTETIQSELNVKNEEARNLESAIAKANQRAGDLVRMAEAEKQRDAAKATQTLAAAAGKELKEIQAGMVEAAFRPLLRTANAVFAGVLPFELEYRDGEIGARAGGVWRGHRTMSGVEKALTYCAIQMALASRAPVKVAVLDEMTKLVSGRVPGFATAILLAINAGTIDQALIVDPERGDLYGTPLTEKLSFQVVPVA